METALQRLGEEETITETGGVEREGGKEREGGSERERSIQS